MRDMVLILNFDGANSRAIAQALRAEQIYCKIVPPTLTREAAAAQQPLGLILAGGTAGSLPGGLDAALLNGEWPVFAMGDAAALLCRSLGGDAQETVLSDEVAGVHFTPCPLTAGMDDCERMLRRVRRLRLPDCAQPLAISREETVGLMHATLPLYGVQFALEQNDTDGMQLLLNFALHVCGCSRWWNYDVYIDRTVEELRRLAGGGRALCAMTGGLGSGICALLSHRALGDRLQCIFIDTGLRMKARSFWRITGTRWA